MPRRRVLAALALVSIPGSLLSGCFRPMLAEGGAPAGLIGRVQLPDFDDRFGYYLNDSLRDRLGRTETAAFRLEVNSRIETEDLAITQDNAVTRIRLIAIADWVLYPVDGGDAVLNDRTVSQSGYNSTASLFATRAGKLDVERRLARDLGERIARSILARAETVTGSGS